MTTAQICIIIAIAVYLIAMKAGGGIGDEEHQNNAAVRLPSGA